MEYNSSRKMAIDLRDRIDDFISKNINRQELADFIREILTIELNKKKLFRVKGLSATVETVLGKARLSLFREILNELGYET
ncbi:MAG: hypothetical protein NC033_04995 [Clostridiales bacterium]|nr:hypothetical protein [Clostridiales bacterium]